MWNLAFKTGSWLQGYAAAIGWIGAFFMIIVVIVLLYLFRVRD